MTGTAIEFPNALYRGPSGACSLPRHGMSVHPSGNPWSRSHSNGVSLLMVNPFMCESSVCRNWSLRVLSVAESSSCPRNPFPPLLFLRVAGSSDRCNT